MMGNRYLGKLLAWCPKESLRRSILFRSVKQTPMLNLATSSMALRMKILEYVGDRENANFFHMARDLKLRTEILGRELKTLVDKGCVKVFEGPVYSLTPEGIRELKQLKGERIN